MINPIHLFKIKNKSKLSNKSFSLRESSKLILNSKNNKGLQAKFLSNYSSNRKNNLNIIKLNFPYCKPIVKNSFSELIIYQKNKDSILAKNIPKNKKNVNKLKSLF